LSGLRRIVANISGAPKNARHPHIETIDPTRETLRPLASRPELCFCFCMVGGLDFRIRHGRRIGLSLLLCCVLLANAILSAALGAQWDIAQADPLRLAALSSLCRPDAGETDPGRPSAPAHQQADCTLCCTACPMSGCAPPAVGAGAGFSLEPAQTRASSLVASLLLPRGGRQLYPSDSLSQAPPRSA
jgi:hypothetical protein